MPVWWCCAGDRGATAPALPTAIFQPKATMTPRIPLTLSLLALAGIMLTGCGSGQDRNDATTKASAAVPIDVTRSKQ